MQHFPNTHLQDVYKHPFSGSVIKYHVIYRMIITIFLFNPILDMMISVNLCSFRRHTHGNLPGFWNVDEWRGIKTMISSFFPKTQKKTLSWRPKPSAGTGSRPYLLFYIKEDFLVELWFRKMEYFFRSLLILQ